MVYYWLVNPRQHSPPQVLFGPLPEDHRMNKFVAITLGIGAYILLMASSTYAQSDPANFDTVINYPTVVSGNTVSGPLPGTTVPMNDDTTQFNFNLGSSSSSNTFTGLGNEVNLFTGSVVTNPTIENGTILNIVGGVVPSGLTVNGFSAERPTVANILSGGINGTVAITGTGSANIQAGFGINLQMSGLASVNVLPGANLAAINAIDGTSANISGGIIGSVTTSNSSSLQLTGGEFTGTVNVAGDSRSNISGGTFVDLSVNTLNDVNIAGGAFESVQFSGTGTKVNISGGEFSDGPFLVENNAIANISGGTFGNDFEVASDAVANVSGGSFGWDVDIDAGGTLNLIGTKFIVDGIDRTSEVAQAKANGQDFTLNPLNPPMLLTGIFTDANQFAFEFVAADPELADEASTLAPNATVNLIVGAPQLDGDFNGDGSVNLADYTVWRDNLGAGNESIIGFAGDGLNGVDGADYLVWKNNFSGSISPLQLATNQIPEPASLAICGVGLVALASLSRNARTSVASRRC